MQIVYAYTNNMLTHTDVAQETAENVGHDLKKGKEWEFIH